MIIYVNGRSREGAWIEMALFCLYILYQTVAPARERGLKLKRSDLPCHFLESLPRGSVD